MPKETDKDNRDLVDKAAEELRADLLAFKHSCHNSHSMISTFHSP